MFEEMMEPLIKSGPLKNIEMRVDVNFASAEQTGEALEKLLSFVHSWQVYYTATKENAIETTFKFNQP